MKRVGGVGRRGPHTDDGDVAHARACAASRAALPLVSIFSARSVLVAGFVVSLAATSYAQPVLQMAAVNRSPAAPDSLTTRDRLRAGLSSAARARSAVVIDGTDADAVWAQAPRIDGFRVTDPTEDGEPSFNTEARVAYDDRNLYVFVRAFDPRPDSIAALLGRRDVRTPSDWIRVMVDSYHDKRTGWAFMLNPASVQRDLAITNDGDEDITWDGVWAGRSQIDSLGWTAEFRIPFNQLRFPPSPEHTFGIMIMRAVQRRGETSSWPVLRRSKVGLASQFGSVAGIDSVPTPRRLEVLPYLVERNVSQASTRGGFGRAQQHAGGLDLKYGLGSNLTVDATVNPDFGQVEADPAVLNLTAFEQFFTERRPFFIEGSGIFRFDTDCEDDSCTGLFYSRRIGRSPSLAGSYGDARSPQFTTIQGASKLTGRTANGTSMGLLTAFTRREEGTESRTIEPASQFLVARAMQDLRGGNSQVGIIATSVTRSLDQWTDEVLRRGAFTGGVDFRHRFAKNRWNLDGYVTGSQVTGSAAAIARTQRSGVHFYQRPGDNLEFDSTRTSLSGYATQVTLQKVGGVIRANTGYQRVSAGFEINDAGFMQRADRQSTWYWVGFRPNKATKLYRNLGVNANQWAQWTAGGQALSAGGNGNMWVELPNFWQFNTGMGVQNPWKTFDDRASRGGPALRNTFTRFGWVGLSLDNRKRVVPGFNAFFNTYDEGRSWTRSLSPRLELRPSNRLQTSLSANYSNRVQDAQWVGNESVQDRTAYTFARLQQTTASLTARFDVTATPRLSLQVYAQPFATTGRYSKLRELDRPAADVYDDRFRSFGDGRDPGGFSFKQFRSNVVMRWEYRPGSTLFAVWSQGRDAFTDEGTADFQAGRELRSLFGQRPDNTFLIKMSYWFAR
jgi:hypothetical protein